jgi:threonine dehydrogenase-like Zn-dependent dehydrogenase
MSEKPPQQDPRSAAINRINGIRGEVSPTGALHDEHDDFNQLVDAVKSGAMAPDKAVEKAVKLAEKRGSLYH